MRILYLDVTYWNRIIENKTQAGQVTSQGWHMTRDVPDHAHFVSWLERYRRAWVGRNAADAGELFTEGAIYREQPFQAPFVGREAIQRWTGRE